MWLMLVLKSETSSDVPFSTVKQLHSSQEGCTQGPSTVVPSTAAFTSLSTSSWVPASLPGSRREESCLAPTCLVQPRKAASHSQNSPQLHETGCQQRSMACIDQA